MRSHRNRDHPYLSLLDPVPDDRVRTEQRNLPLRLRVFHLTRYQYPTPASDSHNEVRLMPLSDRDQTCLDFRLSTSPESSISAYDIPSGRVHNFNVKAAHRELVIRAEALVLTYRQNPFKQFQLISDDMAFYARQDIRQNYYEYLQPTQRVPLTPETDRIAVVAKKQAGQKRRLVSHLIDPATASCLRIYPWRNQRQYIPPTGIGKSPGSLPGFRPPDAQRL